MSRIPRNNAPYWVTMRKLEKDLLVWYLAQADNDVTRAASMAGLTPKLFYKKLRSFDIKRPLSKRGRPRKRTIDDTSIGSLAD